MHDMDNVSRRHRVVVVGGGFGGLRAVRGLRRAPVEVTLVDRQNFTLFQPLVYQVATGALSPAEIARRCARSCSGSANARVVLAEVTGFDLERREVAARRPPERRAGRPRSATTRWSSPAARSYSYFGHDEWPTHAPELKSLAGALDIRSRMLGGVRGGRGRARPGAPREPGSRSSSSAPARPGVEMAGQIAELARDALPRRLPLGRHARRRACCSSRRPTASCRAFRASLSRKAARALEQLGVTPLAGHTVVDVDAESVAIRTPDGERRARRRAHRDLGGGRHGLRARGEARRRGRRSRSTAPGGSPVGPDLTLAGHPEVLALGDMVTRAGGRRHAGAAAGAGAGRDAAGPLRRARDPRPPARPDAGAPFHYVDKGNLATIGRSKAVADIKGVHLVGLRRPGRSGSPSTSST